MYDDIVEKSLLTSLCQREAISPSLAKRGEGRFYDICSLTYDRINNCLIAAKALI
jgi:hypothetical protein